MLSCYRILDLTDEKGLLCGKMLGDLGADVIKIEKPGGDEARNIGPFYHDIVHPEKSLFWMAFNTNKRSITLAIEASEGREIFKKLLKTADVVIESFAPGYMEDIGFGYPDLSKINPALVMTSISGFGQEGPYRSYKAPDIVVRALGGLVYTVGEADRPPLTTSYPHVYLIGSMYGAIGTMIALYHRSFTGLGQRVDAPTQQGLTFVGNVESQVPWMLKQIIPKRNGRKRFPVLLKDGSLYDQPMLWECKDGDIAFTIAAAAMAASYEGLAECMKKDGIDTSPLDRWDWKKDNDGLWTREDIEALLDTFREFFSRHTKEELIYLSIEKNIHLAPCLTPGEALKFPQLVERDFWRRIEHPELAASITYPGSFVKFTEADCGVRQRAPLIGENNNDIYGRELGISGDELKALMQRRVI
jgi:benzylsuccinate CoA-transferase BbsE subunit